MASRPVSGRAVTMLRRMGAATLLLGTGLQGASAQGYSWGYGPEEVYAAPRAVYRAEPALSPRSVADSLQDRGFTEIGRPRFDGRAYVVEATGPRGARLRLVVDARDGAVIGREIVGDPYYPTAIRPRPVTPGYGWTEEDDRPRRMREAEALIPPADIPSAAPSPTYRGPALNEGRARTERAPLRPSLPRQETRQEANAGIAPQVAPEANPYGLNPDAAARPDAARRAVKAAPPAKPQAARTVPSAPTPSLRPAETATPSAKVEEKPADTAPVKSAEPAEASSTVKAAESAPALAPAPKDRAWQNPPADRKPVRVIGGATIVPGGSGETGAN